MNHLLDLETVNLIQELGALRPNETFAQDLYELFVSQSQSIVQNLNAAIAISDLTQVRQLAHRLKGTAATIGATQLSQKAAALEDFVQSPHCDQLILKHSVQELLRFRQESLVALHQILQ